MESGYLLRDVINKVNGIHFDSTEEIHTLGHLYESMLKEMRDAAGDSGEFYTPRAVVRFMVAVTDPRLGEKVLDPACGTGGFLVETYAHLEKQCQTVQQRRLLQEESIFGGEAKPLPYMLCQMNLLLHGLESPDIAKGNSLEQKLTEIKDSDRVDVILTNPPFGGEEERGIQGNFPEDKQTAETALLFLQLIMRKLRITPKPGRAGVVVPNGTLFGDGVCARIKQELLTKFNLHTIVRLPNGVFAPYTSIPTNLLFFDRSGPTEHIWYYEQPLPEGKKNYTKTAPHPVRGVRRLHHVVGQTQRERTGLEGARRKDPGQQLQSRPQEPECQGRLRASAPGAVGGRHSSEGTPYRGDHAGDQGPPGEGAMSTWQRVPLGELLTHRKEFIEINDLETYKRCRVQLHAQGIVVRDQVSGAEIKTKQQQVCRTGEFLVAEIDAKLGGYGIVPNDLEGAIVSSHYFLFSINEEKLDRRFLGYFIRTPAFFEQVAAQGSTNYAAIRPGHVLQYTIPLPPLTEQRRLVERIDSLAGKIDAAQTGTTEIDNQNTRLLMASFNRVTKDACRRPLGEVAPLTRRPAHIDLLQEYPQVSVRSFGRGTFHNPPLKGSEITWEKPYLVKAGDILISNIKAWEGAIAVAKQEDDGRFGSHRYLTYVPVPGVATARFLCFFMLTPEGLYHVGEASPGSADRNRTTSAKGLLEIPVPVPSYEQQVWFGELHDKVEAVREFQAQTTAGRSAMLTAILDRAFRGEL